MPQSRELRAGSVLRFSKARWLSLSKLFHYVPQWASDKCNFCIMASSLFYSLPFVCAFLCHLFVHAEQYVLLSVYCGKRVTLRSPFSPNLMMTVTQVVNTILGRSTSMGSNVRLATVFGLGGVLLKPESVGMLIGGIWRAWLDAGQAFVVVLN